jgi:WD40 repeat protein
MVRAAEVTPTDSRPVRVVTATPPPAIAGYEVLGILGRGGMGVVYKARQFALKRIVALKMILSGSHADEQDLARFRAEAESVARLQHPHIVQVFEIGEADGHPFCALEFVAGGSLAQQIAGTPQAPRRAAELVETLSRAMHHAHQHGIVHRDLKPANVLLAEDGTPKITDFGLAKQIDNPSGQTRSGAVLGTPSYMAPEQAQGHTHRIGPGTDVYALGAILYELLTGRPPFKGETAVDTMLQVMFFEPVPPHRLQPKLPLDLDTICLKCLQKEPARRYASAGELADDVRRFLYHEPIQARPIGRAARLWRWCRREPKAAAVLFLFGLTVAATFVLTLRSRSQALTQATAEVAQRQEAERLRSAADRLADKETKLRSETQRQLARLAFDEAHHRCAHEDVASGLLMLAASLRQAAEAGDRELERRIRTQLAAWDRYLCPLTDMFPAGLGGVLVDQILFGADGKTVLLAYRDRGTVRLRDARAGTPVASFTHASDHTYLFAFGPDRQTVAVACKPKKGAPQDARAGQVQLWDIGAARALGPVCQQPGVYYCLAVRSDNRALLTACHASSIARVWDVETGKQLGVDLRHPDSVSAVAFYPDERVVITGCVDGRARIWELDSGNALRAEFKHELPITAVAASSNKRLLGTAALDGTARLWNIFGRHAIGPPLRYPHSISAAAFRPDDLAFVTASGDHLIRTWNIKPFWPDPVLREADRPVERVVLSADSRIAVSITRDNVLRVRDVRSGKDVGPIIKLPTLLLMFAVNRDGRVLLTVGRDSQVRLWDTATGRPIGAPLTHPSGIHYASLSPDGALIATICPPGTEADIWDVRTGKKLSTIANLTSFLDPLLAFSPDGRMLLAATGQNQAQLWELATRKPVGPPLQHLAPITALAFSADGRTLLTGSEDRTVHLWHAATGKPISPPLPHAHAVSSGAFSPDGRLVATTCSDWTHLWDAKSGRALGPPLWQNDAALASIAFTSDSKAVYASGGDVWSWAVPEPLQGSPEQILRWAQVNTGLEIDEFGGVRLLSIDEWKARRRRLEELGGPPAVPAVPQ